MGKVGGVSWYAVRASGGKTYTWYETPEKHTKNRPKGEFFEVFFVSMTWYEENSTHIKIKCVRELVDHPTHFLGLLREFLELDDGFGCFRKAYRFPLRCF